MLDIIVFSTCVCVFLSYWFSLFLWFVSCSDGPPGALHDKIFISSGAEVKGYSKKGKQFLKFDTNLTEPIRTMLVQ